MKAVCSTIGALAFAMFLSAQSDLPKDVLQLAQIRRDVGTSLASLSNYTCVETILRFERKKAQQPFHHLDTLHLEVAVAKNSELYAWPGAKQFEQGNLGQFVGAGMISTGDFGSAIKSVLLDNVSTIRFHGDDQILGRRARHWDYTIPYNLSRWTVETEGHSERVSETGSFWADSETLELLRLESNAGDIPPDLRISSIKNTLGYARMRVRSKDLLLPQSVELLVTDMKGVETRNQIEFSQCHEFAAAASLSFHQPAQYLKLASPVTEFQVPAGLELPVHLAQAIDSKVSAVGDRITAIFDAPVRYHGQVLIPRAALLQGRIRRLEPHHDLRPHYLVGLEFTDIEFAEHHARFIGELAGVSPIPGLTFDLSTWKMTTTDFGVAGSVLTSISEAEIPFQIPGVSTFFMEGLAFRLPEGMRMTWRSSQLKK